MLQITLIKKAAYHPNGIYINNPSGYIGFSFMHFHTPVHLVDHENFITTQPHACILFAPGTPLEFYSNIPITFDELLFSTDLPLMENIQYNTVYYPSNHQRISELIAEIEEEILEEKMYLEEIASLKTKELLVQLSRTANREDNPIINHKMRKKLADIRTYVFSHLEEDWSVKKMAERMDLSGSHFHSIYRKLFGVSPTDDLIAARIYAAQIALTFGDEPLASIATRLGYHSLSHFVRQFSAIKGCSPAKYRRLYSDKQSNSAPKTTPHAT